MAGAAEVVIALTAIQHALIRLNLLATTVASALDRRSRLQHVTHLALFDGVTTRANVEIAGETLRDHGAWADGLVALVTNPSWSGRSGNRVVAFRALRQSLNGFFFHTRPRSRVTSRTQEPIALAAIHHLLTLLRRNLAQIALASHLAGPELQAMTPWALRRGLTTLAEVPITLLALHHQCS